MMNLATDKGIWQVRPVQYDWDHLDLVGLDTTDYKRTGEELGQFYMSMINNMLKVEELDLRLVLDTLSFRIYPCSAYISRDIIGPS